MEQLFYTQNDICVSTYYRVSINYSVICYDYFSKVNKYNNINAKKIGNVFPAFRRKYKV